MEDCIKMYLRDISCQELNWILLAQEREHWRALGAITAVNIVII